MISQSRRLNQQHTATQEDSDLAEIRRRLDIADTDLLSVGEKAKEADSHFLGYQKLAREIRPQQDKNHYVCWSPMNRVTHGRGKASDAIAVHAVWADLDVKESGGFSGIGECYEAVAILSKRLGTEPAFIISTGRGLQPVWAIIGDRSPSTMGPLLKAWGNLVKQVAKAQGAGADPVFTPDRLLRLPGSRNFKYQDTPTVTVEFPEEWAPIPHEELARVVDSYENLRKEGSQEGSVSRREQKKYLPTNGDMSAINCSYILEMTRGWLADVPHARHPWMLSQAMRAQSAYRMKCIDDLQLAELRRILGHRFEVLLANEPSRVSSDGEFDQAWDFAADTVEAKSSSECWAELGGVPHAHADDSHKTEGLRTIEVGRKFAREKLYGRYIYVPNLNWFKYDGKRWISVTIHDVNQVAATWCQDFVANYIQQNRDLEQYKSAARYLDIRKVKEVIEAALTTDGNYSILVEADSLDTHPDLLNVRNGVIDLSSGTLKPHDPWLYFTKLADVNYRPNAVHADWVKALTAIPPELLDYCQRSFGSGITGYATSDDRLEFHYGFGRNGKTTIINAIFHALGDYAAMIPEDVLGESGGRQHPTSLMTLFGIRFAILEELQSGHRLNSAILKKLVGTPTMTARLMHKNFISWLSSHSIFVVSNYCPIIVDTDNGTWRRIVIIDYPTTFPESADPKINGLGIRERLQVGREQQEAILSWLVAGSVAWFANGKSLGEVPDRARENVEEWRGESDLVIQFVNNWMIYDASSEVRTEELRHHFNNCMDSSAVNWSQRLFTERLTGHSYLQGRGVTIGKNRKRQSVVRGLAFRDTDDEKFDSYNKWSA